MIRSRMGVVTMGAGGSALNYSFDPATGLSNDPQLAYYMQNLTPSQLQTALNGEDPGPGLIDLLKQDVTGTGAGSLPCGTPGSSDPNCTGGSPSSLPSWVWYAGAAVAGVAIIGVLKK